MARAGKATVWKAAALSGFAGSSSAAAAFFGAAASSGAPRAPTSSSSMYARTPSSARALSGLLSSVSGVAPSDSLPLGLGELSSSSREASRSARLRLGPPRPPLAETREVEASSLSAFIARALGPARIPSIAVGLF